MMTTNDVTNRPGESSDHADIPDRARAAGLIAFDHAFLHDHRNKTAHHGRSDRNDA